MSEPDGREALVAQAKERADKAIRAEHNGEATTLEFDLANDVYTLATLVEHSILLDRTIVAQAVYELRKDLSAKFPWATLSATSKKKWLAAPDSILSRCRQVKHE